ncbi:MAG: hypothetical protein AB7J13_17030 [Pyrinomonadaceae bacterium]
MTTLHKHLIALFLVMSLVGCNSGIPFDSAKWKSGDRTVRGKMVGHIVSSKILDRKGREEVSILLGEPDVSEEGFHKYYFDSLSTGVSRQFMFVGFGPDDRVRYVTLADD